jgi:glutaredoxin 3
VGCCLTVTNGEVMIQLYMRDGCPFCQKVLLAAEEIGLKEGEDFTTIDAAPGTPGRDVVLNLGGKAMVPFLVDGDTAMYESGDIIAYLEKRSSTS